MLLREKQEGHLLALSIRQPWAWLIVHAGKDIENRSWFTNYRGRVLIHAAKGMTRSEYAAAADFARKQCGISVIPPYEELQRGGVVGSVEIVDCVKHSKSPWFVGKHGFALQNPTPHRFVPMRGQLGFFKVPASAVPEVGDTSCIKA